MNFFELGQVTISYKIQQNQNVTFITDYTKPKNKTGIENEPQPDPSQTRPKHLDANVKEPASTSNLQSEASATINSGSPDIGPEVTSNESQPKPGPSQPGAPSAFFGVKDSMMAQGKVEKI